MCHIYSSSAAHHQASSVSKHLQSVYISLAQAFYFILLFSLHVSVCRAVKCDVLWDCKQPNRLFVSVTPLQLTHQRLFALVNVHSASENMRSSYYHSL